MTSLTDSALDVRPMRQRRAIPALTSGPGARGRILSTALRLFYYEGIRAVGIDRLIAESKVTKATFYKHYGSKDALVLAYMTTVHDETKTFIAATEEREGPGLPTLTALVAETQREANEPDFRGCPFINVAAEFSTEDHPLRELINEHREWFADYITEQFRRAGHPYPGDAADEYVLLRDGIMVGGYIGDTIAAAAAHRRALQRCLSLIPGAAIAP